MSAAGAAPPLLEAKGLRAQYGPTAVLHGIDFAVAERGITTVLGANGAGKTTLLRAVCAMVRTAGEVRLQGERIDGLVTESIRADSREHTPLGILTRGISGVRGRTLIVNFPGSPKAIGQSWPVVEPTLQHAAETLER